MARRIDPAYVADLANRLLKAKAEAKRLQAEWDVLFSVASISVEGASAQTNRKITLVKRIVALLDGATGTPYTAEQVCQQLGLSNLNSTKTTLSKLVKKQEIKKFGNDKYISILSSSSANSPAPADVAAETVNNTED